MINQEHKKNKTQEEKPENKGQSSEIENQEDFIKEETHNTIGFPDIDIKKQMGCGG